MNTDLLLSDKFIEFSTKVNALHEKKKNLLLEFKKLYDAHKAQVKALEDEAAALAAEFEKREQS